MQRKIRWVQHCCSIRSDKPCIISGKDEFKYQLDWIISDTIINLAKLKTNVEKNVHNNFSRNLICIQYRMSLMFEIRKYFSCLSPLKPLFLYIFLKAWKRNQCWVCIVQYLQSVKTATLKQGIIQFSIVQLIYVKCCFTIILQLHQKWNQFFSIVLFVIIMKKKLAIDLFQILLNSNYLELF